jgi:hypothetical protein
VNPIQKNFTHESKKNVEPPQEPKIIVLARTKQQK